MSVKSTSSSTTGWAQWIPAFGWLRSYQPSRLRGDIVAAITLAAYLLPAGLGRGFPISGGMSQSLVNEGGGARTPLSGALAAGIILVVVLFFSHLLSALPQPVLAAVVLVAAAGLFKLSALKHLWRGDRPEFVVAMAALLGVLGSGLLRGVMIGAVISLVQ